MADALAQRAFGGIAVRNLYKIFGPNASAHVDAVRNGMTKTDLNARHGHVLGLRDINIEIASGSIQVIMGLSGSGKSTLIRHINRLIDPTAGEVLVDGVDVVTMGPDELRNFRRHQTAMVFQKFALLPHRTVLDNTMFGLEIQGINRTTSRDTAMRWLERVGLKGFESKYPNQLSGGMQQRVGLARALSNDAPVLLMDEAYSALDPLIRMDMQSVLLDIQAEIRKTIVFITHDLDEALRLGDQIAILRDGEVIQQGTSQDIVLRPADDYVASFVREVNRGRVVHVEAVMTPLHMSHRSHETAGRVITSNTTIEEALRLLVGVPEDDATVVDATGQPVGTVSFRQLAGAMVNAHDIGQPTQDGRSALPEATEEEFRLRTIV
ncbi:proline/glycine betaine ABC transporter ATP-binding protein [Rhizobium sp. Leaf384]|uniref:quaternary amine ABC transporter ATP-binding protein n=1 Tax=unclassified Rhizobium TaxID=2613769 RepID=UPI0007141F6D|nr:MULTISPECIES: glycine betaine/L-proline ABC transporter ATP-binding protein [unclassified Rhizobium]KQR73007.1 proline/glycine betaine ABC transporter ATP-binding protein [Rhizobium sp. Leaf341]KQS75633.1 proline/glycine betaine ABC transporter ATP-binding protein [Rhizobium sp. Leaf384]KQS75882.1 proline/glycine betaine ABC transporter ATP-binding protein [Rhizobium sp. Leaf383]